MGVPVVYRKSSEATATYDFIDLADGAGVVQLYLSKTQSDYILSRNIIFSDTYYTSTTANNADYVKDIDADFDLTINKPITIKGIMYANIPLYRSGDPAYIYCIVKLRKWDGTTETEIASGTSTTGTFSGGWNHPAMYNVKITVPNTHFKKNETLRVTIEVYGKGNGTTVLSHDPKDRRINTTYFSATEERVASVFVPVVVDI